MNSTDGTVQEQRLDASQRGSTSSGSMSSVGNSISEVATSSMNEVKSKATDIYYSEPVERVCEQVRSVTTGGTQSGNDENQDDQPDDEEIERIDKMDNERIAEFLQEKCKSNRQRPSHK